MKYDNTKTLTENAMAGVDITRPENGNIIYKVVEEWAAPTFYDYDTQEKLYDECDSSCQRLWVVSYDEENKEIIEWLEEYYVCDIKIAKARAKELNKESEE